MRKLLPLLAVAVILTASYASAQVTASDHTNLKLTVANEATFTVVTANTNFSTSTTFADYTGTTSYKYQVRTSQTGGVGSITLLITSDFSDGTLNQPTAVAHGSDSLTFTCAAAQGGTPCGSAQTADKTTAAKVVDFGTNAHAGTPGNVTAGGASSSVNWNFTNDPLYPTGNYTAVATFTISAT